jgi:hypothetical protein
MTITDFNRDRRKGRQGIALVVVLGLLSLLTLMATAFVYFMRTENTTSNYYRMDISSRHVLNVALARALMDVTTNLNSDVYPNWSQQYNAMMSQHDPSDPVMPTCKAEFLAAMTGAISNMPAGSFMPLGVARVGDAVFLRTVSPDFADMNTNFAVINLSQNTIGWIQTIEDYGAEWGIKVSNKNVPISWNANDRFAKIPAPEWNLVDVNQMTGYSPLNPMPSKQVQFAYAIFNCSGLLDANYAGASNAARQMGIRANELQLGALTNEFQDPSALADFLMDRADFGKYESVAELFQNRGFSYWPDNFAVYSRFPPGEFSPSDALVLTGRWDQLQKIEGDFTTRLIASDPSRFNNVNSKWVFDSLVDYLDLDSIPSNAVSVKGGPSTELCPMINEIGITNRIVLKPDGTLTHVMTFYVEVCYPFMELPLVNNYSLEVDFQFGIGGGSTDSRFVPSPAIQTFTKSYPIFPAMAVGNKYRAINLGSIQTSGIYTNLAATKQNLSLRVQVKRAQIFDSLHQMVDAVPYPTNDVVEQLVFFVPSLKPAGVTLPATAVATTNTINLGWSGMECVDPRFNWRRASPTNASDFFWKTYQATNSPLLSNETHPSIGTVNHCATNDWTTTKCSDPFDTMYVLSPTNSKRTLQSISELGYLPVGKWDTIRLVGGPNYPPDRIFDIFALSTNGVARGKINPNTYDADVLASAFFNMPLDQYPYQNTATVARLSVKDAYELAVLWTNSIVQQSITNYTGLIAHMTNMMDTFSYANNLFATTNHNPPFRNESLIRNSVGLFDARQNYFFVVIMASEIARGFQAQNTGVSGMVFGFNTRAGLVELWRDPYVVNGQNSLVIRNYRLLDE